jgi:hypothetical protein
MGQIHEPAGTPGRELKIGTAPVKSGLMISLFIKQQKLFYVGTAGFLIKRITFIRVKWVLAGQRSALNYNN